MEDPATWAAWVALALAWLRRCLRRCLWPLPLAAASGRCLWPLPLVLALAVASPLPLALSAPPWAGSPLPSPWLASTTAPWGRLWLGWNGRTPRELRPGVSCGPGRWPRLRLLPRGVGCGWGGMGGHRENCAQGSVVGRGGGRDCDSCPLGSVVVGVEWADTARTAPRGRLWAGAVAATATLAPWGRLWLGWNGRTPRELHPGVSCGPGRWPRLRLLPPGVGCGWGGMGGHRENRPQGSVPTEGAGRRRRTRGMPYGRRPA